MVPSYYFYLKKLVTCLLKLFVKVAVVDNCKTSVDLANIDLIKRATFMNLMNLITPH